MPAKSTTKDSQSDQGLHSVLQSSIYSQPWWRGVGNSHTFDENTTKPSAAAHLSSSLPDNGAIRSQASSAVDGGANSNKDTQITITSQSDGDNGQETHLIQVPSSVPVTTVGHLETNPQMELVGHSIVLTSYPYSDAQYGGILPSYVPQAMVPPQLCGMHHARMALPLEMEEEPVYVNAKQFNGILRRRQARAKAELERKVIKVRKPYLHESRHQHAMRRARGCGGRFLSSKKSEDNSTKPASDKDANSCTNLSRQSTILLGSDWLQKNAARSLDSSKASRQEGKESTGQDLQSHSSSHTKNGHGVLSVCDTASGDWMERGFSYQQRLANGAVPH